VSCRLALFDHPVFKARRLRFGAVSRLRGIIAWKIRNKAPMDARDIFGERL
jgi:hypothetical protein